MNNEIFLIEKAWIDPMENRNADGYTPVGYVTSLEEAEEIVKSGGFYTSEDCWSVQYHSEGKMNKYRYTKLIKFK